eukprot:TRINITY_DN746_c0_g2_i2.p1 TRINITY_DN746_c0_g2~~TRINITY_DN746_c0_g2_i2.p1  ORF type:complete len:206 (+),score=22.52 TRINITY_DN746_c0_g2_i2:424-1041(+)
MSSEEHRGPTIDSIEDDYMTVPRPTGDGTGWSPRSRIPSAGRVTIANPPTRPAQRGATLNTRAPPKFPAILAEPSDTEGSDSVDARSRGRTGKGRKKLRRKRKTTRQRSVPPGPGTGGSGTSGGVKRAPLYHGSVAAASSPRPLHKAASQGHGLGASMPAPGQEYPYGGGLGNMQQVAVSPRDNKVCPPSPSPSLLSPLSSLPVL